MDKTNEIYSAPESKLTSDKESKNDPKILLIAKGQKLILYGIICYISVLPLKSVSIPLALIALLLTIILSIWGAITLLRGMEMFLFSKIMVFVLLFVPFVNFFVLIFLNRDATKRLRYAGYKVGLLGAKK